ncbi:glutathione-S-transferase [Sistotremastrum niveocremeum HHB9708]|uniref:Glutathione-S-transferase n=1 Tax=Sistotremastrum niveocremeum HHB9708 TaxID=1314777 RepID=A0A164MMD9_9AGAM|nr:glutathione-S-transferase [Sistotremastrum niveocremeum HHB9708]
MPDADIHPNATGRALKVVEAHQEPADLMFYAGWFCPFVQRVWIALEEKGIHYQYKEENPYHKDKEFLKVSPKGLVPALVHNDKPIHESLVILEYLEEAFPNTKPLLPQDPYTRSLVRLSIDHTSKSIIPTFFKLLQSQDASSQDSARSSLYEALQKWSDGMLDGGKGPWWAGEEMTLADVVLMPFIGRLYILEENRAFDLSRTNEKFSAWVKHALAHPSMEKTSSERNYYAQIYNRYLKNEAQSEAAKATRSGGVIP